MNTYKTLLTKLLKSQDLTYDQSTFIAHEMLQGNLSDTQISAILVSLKIKGESSDEIAGFANALRENAKSILIKSDSFDTCGTGGDGSNSFNISTTSAFIIAGAGVKVAKHGNRSISSSCGSADVLHELGINIALTSEEITHQIDSIGMSFLFAPNVHPKMKHVMPARQSLGIPTIFNIIGPLCNPVDLGGQVIGVYSPSLLPKVSSALLKLGIKNAAVIHGHGHVDELSMSGPNLVHIIKNGHLSIQEVRATDYGFKTSCLSDIEGGDSKENARILHSILSDNMTGPMMDVALLNSGLGLYIAGKTDSIAEGIQMARRSIKEGSALNKLNQLIEYK